MSDGHDGTTGAAPGRDARNPRGGGVSRGLSRGLVALLLLATAALTACARLPSQDTLAQQQARRQEAKIGRQEIRDLLRDLQLADSTEDIEGLMALYARDARWVTPGQAPVEGREALGDRYREIFAEFEQTVVLEVDTVSVEGDAGQVWGWSAVTLVPRRGGEALTQQDRFRMVLERGEDRRWRILLLEWRPWPRPERLEAEPAEG